MYSVRFYCNFLLLVTWLLWPLLRTPYEIFITATYLLVIIYIIITVLSTMGWGCMGLHWAARGCTSAMLDDVTSSPPSRITSYLARHLEKLAPVTYPRWWTRYDIIQHGRLWSHLRWPKSGPVQPRLSHYTTNIGSRFLFPNLEQLSYLSTPSNSFFLWMRNSTYCGHGIGQE